MRNLSATRGERSRAGTGPRGLALRDLLPLVGFAVPTLVTAYGVVMPRHGITGVNELTLGFASAILGACATYVFGLRAALTRRAGATPRSAAARWRRPEWIARQSARPSGIVGWILGRIMGAETANANDHTIALAEIPSNAHVLDVGCGPGYAVDRVAGRLTGGRVIGVDPSPAMVRMAARRNARWTEKGRAVISVGDARHLPLAAESIDRVLATHTIYFWPDLESVARELRRVLKPDGRLVLCFGDADRMRRAFPTTVYTLRSIADIEGALLAAGFRDMVTVTHELHGEPLHWLVAGPCRP